MESGKAWLHNQGTIMQLTTSQNAFYGIVLSASEGQPMTNALRTLLMSVNLEPFNITPNDQSRAIRKYESVVGLYLDAPVEALA
jgi:hypothetical protein